MLFEKVEKRRFITFHFKASTVDVGECIQPQQHWSKQHSKVVNPQERLVSIIQTFAKVFRRLYHLPMKYETYIVFYYLPLTCFTTFFSFQHWTSAWTLKFLRHMFRVFWLTKLCHCFCNAPTPFLITFLLTRQLID